MIALLEVLGIYSGLALVAVYGIWWLIGRQGFIGLDDTDSLLAKHFRKRTAVVSSHKPAASGART
jgi:hypothetical protein